MSVFLPLLVQRIRRDRWQVPLWAAGTALLALLSYAGVSDSYGTEADRSALLATALANPVILLFRGLPSGPDAGAFMLFLIFPFLAMLAAFMSTFLAVRHTRGDEESGRAELVAASPAARLIPLLATLAHGALANVALAVLTAAAFVACGLPVGGSLVSGFGAGAVGLAYLGVGLVAAQGLPTSRSANSASVWILLVGFLLAGIGNAIGTPSANLQRIESSGLVWLTPFGWGEQSRPFAADDLRPLVLCVAAGLVLAAAAITVQAVRDVGEGLVPERRGRATAGALLSSPVALVWRLTAPAIVGWCVGGLVTGLLATKLAEVLQRIATDIPSVQAIIAALSAGGSLAQGAVVVYFTLVGILAACCAVQIVCRARQEEAAGTAEPVLAAGAGRMRWLAAHLAVGTLGVVLVVAAAVAGAAAGLASQSDPDWTLLPDAVVVGAGQVAAASVFLVVTALVFVVAPRLTIPVGWTLVLIGTILGLFGALFGFPDAVVHLAPIADGPTVTRDGVDLRGLWWLIVAVAVGGGASLALMRQRELAAAG